MSELRARITSKSFLKRERVEGFGETVGVQQISVEDMRPIRREFTAINENADLTENDKFAEMLVLSCLYGTVDPDSGERVFQDEDASWLRAQPVEAIAPVAKAFLKLNGMAVDEEDESLGKSSETQSDTPPSA
jgi:hypothetical protein